MLALVVCLTAASGARAQEPQFQNGDGITVVSQSQTGREIDLTVDTTDVQGQHKIDVLLPEGYDANPSTHYPVLYLLNGALADPTQWTTDGGEAGLHFVALQAAIEDFVATRTAMNASGAQLRNPSITDTVNNGINEFIFVTKRGNYLLPARAERSFPLLPGRAAALAGESAV